MNWNEWWETLVNSQEIIRNGGLFLVFLIVLMENGVIFGFFLPGDYLLFSAGLLCGTGDFKVHILILYTTILGAAISGSYLGYLFGKFLGKQWLHSPEKWYFKKEYIVKTRYYYIKYAGNTLIIGRFLPIVRTFAPVLAGIIQMQPQKFWRYNIIGGFLWVTSMVIGGFVLGVKFPSILNYLEYIVFGFVGLTSIVVIRGMLSSRKKPAKKVLTGVDA